MTLSTKHLFRGMTPIPRRASPHIRARVARAVLILIASIGDAVRVAGEALRAAGWRATDWAETRINRIDTKGDPHGV